MSQPAKPDPRLLPKPPGSPAETATIRTNRPPSGRATNAVFEVSGLPQTTLGGVTVQTIVAAIGSHKLSFLPPREWHVRSEKEQKRITLLRPGTGSQITIELEETKGSQPVALTEEACRHRVSTRYPAAKLVDEFPISAQGHAGRGHDLEAVNSAGQRQRVRVGIIAVPGGILTCILTARPESLPQEHYTFNHLLLSLRLAYRDARLQLPPITPE